MKTERLALFDALEIFNNKKENFDDKSSQGIPEEFMLIKFGKNEFTRNGKHGDFEFSENDAERIIEEFNSRRRDLVIDYEHQTLKGGEAPAAGWIEKLEKTTEGLVAKVKYWTDKAAALLKAHEYRYVSPVLLFSRRVKSVSAIHSVALTNHPAMHDIPALVADDFAAGLPSDTKKQQKEKGKKKMNELLTLLDLLPFSDSDDEDAVFSAAAEKVRELVALRDELQGFLKFHDCDSLNEITGMIQSMVPASEKLELENKITKREAENAVAVAFSEGKLAESSRQWALDFAAKDLLAFRDWAENAPRIVPDNSGIEQKSPERSSEKSRMSARHILANLGLAEKDIDECFV